MLQKAFYKRFKWLQQKQHSTAYFPRGGWTANLIIPPFPRRLPGQPYLSNQAHPMPDGMNRRGRELSPPRGAGTQSGRLRRKHRKETAGQRVRQSVVASGADRIVELCRAYPVRPYLVEGGGRGFTIPNSWGANETNWAVVKEFEMLWWSDAGDAIVERYADRLPMVGRSLWEKNEPDGVRLPRSRTDRRP